MAERQVLHGGVANAGLVVREGDYVLRPSNAHTELIHALLRHLRANGFDGVPEPIGIDPDGRERLVFIQGDVAIPPFPTWSRSDDALASIARLMARFHRASTGFEPPSGTSWSSEMADPVGGDVVCHNDVCLENVVFRDGNAAALLDFDFAAPGRPMVDLVTMARMCVPIEAPEDARDLGPEGYDPFRRLRLVADSYGLPPGREELVRILDVSMSRGGEFVRRRVERGDAAFIAMWEEMGGQARFDRRAEWFARNRVRFVEAVG